MYRRKDYSMPGMTGAEFARYVRGSAPEIPVVLTTGFLEGEATNLAHESVISAVLPKPFTSGQLRDAMARAFASLPR